MFPGRTSGAGGLNGGQLPYNREASSWADTRPFGHSLDWQRKILEAEFGEGDINGLVSGSFMDNLGSGVGGPFL